MNVSLNYTHPTRAESCRESTIMNPAEIEQELLKEAIDAFHGETGLMLGVIQEQVTIGGVEVDAIIEAPHGGGKLAVEVKRWAQQANMGALADQVKRLPMDGVLVADYINPNMGKKLRAMDVQYFDTAGNAYINRPPLYIYISGNKQPEFQVVTKKGTNRAFDAAGMKVIFGFLCDSLLVEAPYREIAERTGVALGTVGWVLNGLKDAGFVIERGKRRRLVNQRKMLDRWVETYPEKLKPKLLLGEFIAEDPYWWQDVDIEEYGAYWGGELAAAKYTDYLKPQAITIYLPEKAGKKLLAKAKLRKAAEWTADGTGIVEIYRPFWIERKQNRENTVKGAAGLVNPILVYADLIATGDSRNIEAARMIYERFISKHIREN